MWKFARLRKALKQYFSDMRWYTIVLALIFYATSSWLMLYAAGESALLSPADFFYWLMVTGSTVGYGDLSPQSVAGKYIVALYVIPFGLSIFALVIGRIATWVSLQWRKGVRGLKTLDVNKHILLVGWNGDRTRHLIKMLLQERKQLTETMDIVLCVVADIENPLPGVVEFVKVESFNRDEEMDRANIEGAAVIILDNPADDITMTCALYASKRNPNANIIAYFKDESLVDLLQQHCPNVECTPSVAVELLAKSAFDPGSSLLHQDLLSLNDDGQAQYSMAVPDKLEKIQAEHLFINLKRLYGATFIGYVDRTNKNTILLNPDYSTTLHPGDKVFYIAASRLNDIDWDKLAGVGDV